jgi:hypothetical protein
MKWILVWIVVFPPAGPNQITTWEYSQEAVETMEECFGKMVERDVQLKDRAEAGEIMGHEIYCKERYVD